MISIELSIILITFLTNKSTWKLFGKFEHFRNKIPKYIRRMFKIFWNTYLSKIL